MTLIEVVASLALLGTLLGATVVAKSQFTHQWQTAQDRGEAVALLETQVLAWHVERGASEADGPDENQSAGRASMEDEPFAGELGKDGWTWRAAPVEVPDHAELYILRFTAHRPDGHTLATIDVFAGYETAPNSSESVLTLPTGTNDQGGRR
ncbi:MAG: hypothetical protein AAF911_15285 [Planctomycetota bacterium]